MRRLLAMLLMLGVAACHAPPSLPVERAQVTPAPADVSLDDLFRDWFSVNIAEHCGATLSDAVARDDCIKTMILTGFDESGQARKDCRRNSGLVWFSECVIYGSLARELLVKRNPRMTIDLNWRAAKASLLMVFDKTISSEVRGACARSALETLHVCEREQLAKSLGLPSQSATICGSGKVSDWRQCIFNAYFSKELAEATARLRNQEQTAAVAG